MKSKFALIFIVVFLFVSLYVVVFRTRTVTYKGENSTWSFEVNARLVGLNGSYNIMVHYKGTKPVRDIDYSIYPHYNGDSYFSLNAKGNHYYECNDCGYYDQEQELLLFISWKENRLLDERMQWIKLRKTN